MIQQPPSYNFLITRSHHRPNNNYKKKSLPSVLIDFTAMVLCELIPRTIQGGRSLPELLFFVQKITHQANINCRTLLVALIYLQRAKSHLPKRAVGSDDTAHRMFLGAILLASKFLQDSAWAATTTISNRMLYQICNGLFTIEEIFQLERAFLKLIQYNCWLDEKDLESFVLRHRQDFSI
ncbi:hypothetical protein G6F57_007166 [Rhizopus arrhizus]|uniref:Cyclin N-terminal domain-containing protein n=1 Tax=Rhizopus oryzae TaxID=64495 RepID=A0A9P6X8L4_RHIOR|nr:hypothetical protein G6F23_013127 [Rhizopus arrhizus]KAG1417302.1 hypothetical protein G6F58_005583 [Rhizopus delemar]KAG0762513.1 hypothetical protein G6F24_006747 [Rhizopus arrhizus]KAG0773469.1 hypothetical protein G6F22_014848 [Rhizopus arrhizus]KAG0788972.1 hypothetical protein G6F21_006832 [Rhizopus arrhizus]